MRREAADPRAARREVAELLLDERGQTVRAVIGGAAEKVARSSRTTPGEHRVFERARAVGVRRGSRRCGGGHDQERIRDANGARRCEYPCAGRSVDGAGDPGR